MTCTILSSNTQDLTTKSSIKCSSAMRLSRTMVSYPVSQMLTPQKLSKLVMTWSCHQHHTNNTRNKTKLMIEHRAVLKMWANLVKDRFNLLPTKEKERNQPALPPWKTKLLHKLLTADNNKTAIDLSPEIKVKAPSNHLTSNNSNHFRPKVQQPHLLLWTNLHSNKKRFW